MNKLIGLPGLAIALALGACAQMSDTVGVCSGSSVCPIIIYEKFPNVFATFPDRMSIYSDRPDNYPTLIWTFADQSKYTFLAKTNTPSGDGVELIGANGAKIGLKPCFITSDSRKDLGFASQGPYLRCEVKNGVSFTPTRYRVRFHTVNGVEKMVDPTVDSTGSGDVRGRRAAVTKPSYYRVSAKPGESVHVPVINGYDGIEVVWDAGPNGSFKDADAAYVLFYDQSGDVDLEPCFISSDANGSSQSSDSRYFYCLLTTTLSSFAYKYDTTFNDGSSVKTVKGVDFIRP